VRHGTPDGSGQADSTVPDVPDPNAPRPPPRTVMDRLGDTVEDDWDELFDRILPALGPPEAAAAGTLKMAGAGLMAVRLGLIGEKAVRSAYNIGGRGYFMINGRLRISDGLSRALGTLSEVKNVKSLSYSRQLRDYAEYARSQGLQFHLYVRKDTYLSAPLVEAVRAREIILRFIP